MLFPSVPGTSAAQLSQNVRERILQSPYAKMHIDRPNPGVLGYYYCINNIIIVVIATITVMLL